MGWWSWFTQQRKRGMGAGRPGRAGSIERKDQHALAPEQVADLNAAWAELEPSGDTVATALGFYPILIARKHGLGKGVIARMLFNLGVNFAAGLTPLVGDAADVFIRVNIRNVALLRQTAVKKGLVSA